MNLSVDLAATFSADGADDFHVAADFAVADGETVVVLGPSGSGKTLLLETIAGFHDHEGTVTQGDRTLSDNPPEERGFGFVFQDYALFPHMTAAENVAFGQSYRESERDPETLLADLGVGGLADRYPPTLSGGEQQRVALARALAVEPRVMLLDEPLSSLDVPTRQSLRDDLQDVLADVTSVYVTHNRTTARALADRIVVMNDGQVVQTGTPEDVFDRPATPLIARFTGSNVVPVESVPALSERLDAASREASHLAFRPESLRFVDGTDQQADLTGTVERVTREDATFRVVLAVATGADDTVRVDAFTDDPPAPGATASLSIPPAAVHGC